MARLGDLADFVRSKNAGPYEVTIDILFRDRAVFERVRDSGVINAALFAKLYSIDESRCIYVCFTPGLLFKCTIPRPVPSGSFGDTDGYGSQQYVPLIDVEIPD